MAALSAFPPVFDHTLQYKSNFKAMLESRKNENKKNKGLPGDLIA